MPAGAVITLALLKAQAGTNAARGIDFERMPSQPERRHHSPEVPYRRQPARHVNLPSGQMLGDEFLAQSFQAGGLGTQCGLGMAQMLRPATVAHVAFQARLIGHCTRRALIEHAKKRGGCRGRLLPNELAGLRVPGRVAFLVKVVLRLKIGDVRSGIVLHSRPAFGARHTLEKQSIGPARRRMQQKTPDRVSGASLDSGRAWENQAGAGGGAEPPSRVTHSP